ncbi:hypothetical protein MYCTH_2126704 [Thermothelomyces thermophilus ATCC 42464]|uniref:Uncharacterized protein n=1 Tax=Thermothelomyces thermophilus (strain ATCC 42464 / BCRC 31852 / DSM 1799) TaxID=573729 RepID=G2QEC1_THET4|nr:uncharacterized protein MYCTH_2126704 [Thermothelomyces thermophilus ATCC 42464]AEO57704.1 hypothetical protein MYCTH_2126704 [Thermothelomyces thermophilus ATCC 42464]
MPVNSPAHGHGAFAAPIPECSSCSTQAVWAIRAAAASLSFQLPLRSLFNSHHTGQPLSRPASRPLEFSPWAPPLASYILPCSCPGILSSPVPVLVVSVACLRFLPFCHWLIVFCLLPAAPSLLSLHVAGVDRPHRSPHSEAFRTEEEGWGHQQSGDLGRGPFLLRRPGFADTLQLALPVERATCRTANPH